MVNKHNSLNNLNLKKGTILFIAFLVLHANQISGIKIKNGMIDTGEYCTGYLCGNECSDYNCNSDYINSLDMSRDVKSREKINEIKAQYFSFRGAETISPEDIDLEDVLELDRKRKKTKIYKTAGEEQYDDLDRYKYAMGATQRDRRFDYKKEADRKIVLVITPKNYFADKDSKLVLLPSLALKISPNSKISVLLEKIKKIMEDAHPNLIIERVRHLKTKIILNEVDTSLRLSNLKIKNGDEISVTYKEIPPEISEQDTDTPLESFDYKNEYIDELFDTYEELPLTPVVPLNVDKLDLLTELPEHKTPSVVYNDEEFIDDNNNRISNGILNNSLLGFSNKIYNDMKNETDLDYELYDKFINRQNNSNEMNNVNEYEKIKFIPEDIDLERAVEPESIESDDEIPDLMVDTSNFTCNYKIYFRLNKNNTRFGLDTDQLYQVMESENSNKNAHSNNIISNIEVKVNGLNNCVIGKLINETISTAKKLNSAYSLIKLKHYPSKINLMNYLKTPEKSLFDIGIIPGDKFEAILQENLQNTLYYDNIVITELNSTLDNNKNRNKLISQNNVTSLLVYVEANLIKPEKIDEHMITKKKTLDGKLTISIKKKTTCIKTLKPVSIDAFMYTPINLIIKKIKYKMKIEASSDLLFICGDSIINVNSRVPISSLNGICVLRLNT